MNDNAIEIRGLVKKYPRFQLGALDLTVPRGAVYALIGPNGAGKTTAIDMIFGMGRNDAGLRDPKPEGLIILKWSENRWHALVAGAAWFISGSTSAVTVLGGYTFTLAPAALCVCFAVWRGGGLLSSGFLLLTLIGAFVLNGRGISVPLSALIVVACVGSGFLLTRGALNRSRHAYLSRSAEGTPWGAVAWEATR